MIFRSLIGLLFALSASPCSAQFSDADDSLKRYSTLRELSGSLKELSTKSEVTSILGEPDSKGIMGWDKPDTKVWTYLDYADDDQHLYFSVTFDPQNGCSSGGAHTLRAEFKDKPLRTIEGLVRSKYQLDPADIKKGFVCQVEFDEGTILPISTVQVNSLERVTGVVKPGARIRVVHRGTNNILIFVGYYSLFLESITFTDESG